MGEPGENDLNPILNLDGPWLFKPGENTADREINVPGCWESQGLPFSLEGPAKYRKDFWIPADWDGQRIFLQFDAVSYACKVSCNGQEVGFHRGMWTPFRFDITSKIIAGSINTIEVEVTKTGFGKKSLYPVRANLAGFLPDLAGTFGGIWQPVSIKACRAEITQFLINTIYDEQSLRIECHASLYTQQERPLVWHTAIYFREELIAEDVSPFIEGKPLLFEQKFTPVKIWSPDHPDFYTVIISILCPEGTIAHASRIAAFRKLSADKTQLLLNEYPFLIRGILSWGWNPDKIAPYYTLDEAKREIQKIRSMGFNCIKLCLFIPNPEFFRAADEEGMLLWLEFPMWLPELLDDFSNRAPQEYLEIASQASMHPSIVLYSLGCELNKSIDEKFLGEMNRIVRDQVHDVLVCDNSGSGESYDGLDVDFADFSDYHPYFDIHFFEPLLNHWRRDWSTQRPWIFGEFCDSDTFRDLDDLIKENHSKRPWWMTKENPVSTWRSEAQALVDEQSRIIKAGLFHAKKNLVKISYNQAYLIRKYTLETLRKRSGMGGYVITGLRDTPISTSGIWDDLWQPKWTADEFLKINGDDILCLETDRRRAWTFGGDRPDIVDAHNFWGGTAAKWHVIFHTSTPLNPGSRLVWQLSFLEGEIIAEGKCEILQRVEAGSPEKIASIHVNFPMVFKASILLLSVTLEGMNRVIENHWYIYLYPIQFSEQELACLYDPSGLMQDWGGFISNLRIIRPEENIELNKVVITAHWDVKIQNHFDHGGKILLIQSGGGPFPARRVPFWREAINFFIDHPIWQDFPHQGYTGMQFFGIACDTIFEKEKIQRVLPQGTHYHPIMRRLDAREFHLNDYIFEARLGNGLLVGCSLRINGGVGSQPSGLRRNIAGAALVQGIIKYLSSTNNEYNVNQEK